MLQQRHRQRQRAQARHRPTTNPIATSSTKARVGVVEAEVVTRKAILIEVEGPRPIITRDNSTTKMLIIHNSKPMEAKISIRTLDKTSLDSWEE